MYLCTKTSHFALYKDVYNTETKGSALGGVIIRGN